MLLDLKEYPNTSNPITEATKGPFNSIIFLADKFSVAENLLHL